MKYTLIYLFFLVIGCNSDPAFKSSNGHAGLDMPDSGDALPDSSDAVTGTIEHKEIIAQDTLVEKKNPFGASDSNIFSFEAAQTLDEVFRFTLDNRAVQTEFQLVNNYSDRTELFEQITRTPVSQNFTQGNSGTAVNETFDQQQKRGIVDILIVVDDSASMSQEQKNLSTKLLDLLSYIDETNWKIGFVTTTAKNQCDITLIPHDDPQAETRFRQAAQPGTKGSGNEMGIRQAVNGLRCTENPWVRADSTLAVLIVSDEDNCSKDGSGCSRDPWGNEDYLIDYVENTMGREVGKDAAFYGIFSHPDKPCNTAANVGKQYQRLVEYKANGEKRWGDICDASYSDTLRKISENIASLLLSQWELAQTPDAGSTVKVEIELNGVKTPANPAHYQITGRILKFVAGHEPPPASKIHVSYRVGASPIFDRVTIRETPAANTLRVMVNGNILNESAYQLSGTTVIFAQQPPENAQIQIDYRKSEPKLKQQFEINGTPRNNQLQVSIDGAPTNGFSYDPINKILNLDMPPADGQKINVRYSDYIGPKLSYELPLSGNNPRNFEILYNGELIDFERNQSVFTIGSDDHEENRILTLRYRVDDGSEKSFSIPHLPIPSSIVVDSMDSECELGNGIEVENQTLVTRCVVRDRTDFELRYEYLASLLSFTISGLTAPEVFIWEVYVDGKLITNYKRQGNTIELLTDPGIGARVDVHLIPKD